MSRHIATLTIGIALVLGGGCASEPRDGATLEGEQRPPEPPPREIPPPPAMGDPTPRSSAAPAADPAPAPAPRPRATWPDTPVASSATPAAGPRPHAMVDFGPGVRVDAESRTVEFDGIVPIDTSDADAPIVYLELVACSPDTREHESLVMTAARPSAIHAAMLLIGLEPGKPGSFEWTGADIRPVPPEGDRVTVTLIAPGTNGVPVERDVSEWIVSATTGTRLPRGPGAAWVFAGSTMKTLRTGGEVYDADGAGTVIGLATFGSEMIAWEHTFSPDASVAEPVWAADPATVPPAGTPVTVRLRPAPGRSRN